MNRRRVSMGGGHRRGRGLSRLAQGFTPTQLSGCVLWLRADLGITLNGATVSAWADQSGAGHNASQGTAANQPTYNTSAFGSKPGVVFNGSTKWMQTSTLDLTGTSKITVFWAGLGTTATTQMILEHGPGGTAGNWSLGTALQAAGDVGAITYAAAGFSEETFSPSGFGSACQVNCVYDTTQAQASQQVIRYNRAAASTANHSTGTASGNFLNVVLNLGARNGGASLFLNGTFWSAIIYNRALAAGEIALVENELAAEIGTP